MSKFSCDINTRLQQEQVTDSYLLVADEVPNYLVTILLYRGTSYDVGEALKIICLANITPFLILDLDQTFLSSLMQNIYKRLGIKIKTLSPCNDVS